LLAAVVTIASFKGELLKLEKKFADIMTRFLAREKFLKAYPVTVNASPGCISAARI
jgi:hypothetical protein